MPELTENAHKVFEALQSGIKFRGELRDLTGLHYSAINDALYELQASGQVETVETTLKTYYRVAGSGEQPPAPGAPPTAVAETETPTRPSREPRKAARKSAAKEGARKGSVSAARRSAPRSTAPASVSPPPV